MNAKQMEKKAFSGLEFIESGRGRAHSTQNCTFVYPGGSPKQPKRWPPGNLPTKLLVILFIQPGHKLTEHSVWSSSRMANSAPFSHS